MSTELDPLFAELLSVDDGDDEHPQPWDLPFAAARAAYREMMLAAAGRPVEVRAVHDRGLVADLTARQYEPAAASGRPTVLYVHGGGWVFGDLDTHDGVARALCAALGTTVVAIAPPSSPEHPPAEVQAAIAAAVGAVHEEVGAPVVLAGDSSGANLAAVVAARHPSGLAAQLLLYPFVDAAREYPDSMPCGRGYWFEAAHARWFVGQYRASTTWPADDPRLSPLRAPAGWLAAAPPAVVVAAEYDLLCDQGRQYVERLRGDGARAELVDAAGLIHGFAGFAGESPAAFDALTAAGAALDRVIHA